ncbi:MAG: alpha/beta hydrolase [Sandaracinus sp.]
MSEVLPNERQVVANGLSHHVLEWSPPGALRTILCCHGYLDVGASWDLVAQHLVRAGFRVVAFDFRGHGGSEWVKAGGYYHFADYVFDLSDLALAVAPDGFDLVGHSMGGTVSAMFAGLRPPGLRRLVLAEGLGPPESPPDHLPDRIAEWIHGVRKVRASTPRPLADLDEAVRRLRSQHPDLDAELGRWVAERSTRRDAEGRLFFAFDPLHRTRSPLPFRLDQFRALLSRIQAPTLYVAGERGFRLADERERLGAIADLRMHELPDVGHMMHWHAPEAFAREIVAHVGAAR